VVVTVLVMSFLSVGPSRIVGVTTTTLSRHCAILQQQVAADESKRISLGLS
jgi:hypothetical protein